MSNRPATFTEALDAYAATEREARRLFIEQTRLILTAHAEQIFAEARAKLEQLFGAAKEGEWTHDVLEEELCRVLILDLLPQYLGNQSAVNEVMDLNRADMLYREGVDAPLASVKQRLRELFPAVAESKE